MFILSLTHTKKRQEERKGEGYATSPSGDTTVLSRKELREPATRDLFSWKIIKTLPFWSCAHKRREGFKMRRIAKQPNQVQWSFREIMEQGNSSAHVTVFSNGPLWWNKIHQFLLFKKKNLHCNVFYISHGKKIIHTLWIKFLVYRV
jgi:hypothetical protein